MKKYRLLVKYNLVEFNKLINDHLEHGWELYGDTKFVFGDGGHTYVQAVVKKEPFDEPV